jgi:hypothetical protein
MSIICIEGASAVGKTTVCRLLEELHGFKRIPEVNELFPRISGESRNWYFERQIDRWKIGRDISSSGGTAVLDGDPFQPIWYNWTYQKDGLQSLSETVEFFRENVVAGNIQLPDKYYVLTISRAELTTRKNGDRSRTRRNFEKHLRLIEPQLDYFEAMNAGSARFAHVLDSIDSRNVAQKIATDHAPALEKIERIEAFERVCKYVCETHDHQFHEINRAVE